MLVPWRLPDKKPATSAEAYQLIDVVKNILTGHNLEAAKQQIDPEAYIVLGNSYEHLLSVVSQTNNASRLVEDPQSQNEFTRLTMTDAQDAAYLVVKTSSLKDPNAHYHTVVFMLNKDSKWKIMSWHTSK